MVDVFKCICGSRPNVGKKKQMFCSDSIFVIMCLNKSCGLSADSTRSLDSAIELWNNNILYLEKKKKEKEDKMPKDYTPKLLCHCGVPPHIEAEKSGYTGKVRYAIFCGNTGCALRSYTKDTMEEAISDWSRRIFALTEFVVNPEVGGEKRSDKMFCLVCISGNKIGIKLFDGRFVIDPSSTQLKNSEILSIFEGLKDVKTI